MHTEHIGAHTEDRERGTRDSDHIANIQYTGVHTDLQDTHAHMRAQSTQDIQCTHQEIRGCTVITQNTHTHTSAHTSTSHAWVACYMEPLDIQATCRWAGNSPVVTSLPNA
jgi:hypothetical protein